MWLLQLAAVDRIIKAGRDPLSLSVAAALKAVRLAMRRPKAAADLAIRLAGARKDGYRRRASKSRTAYPRKGSRRPPGEPTIRRATKSEIRQSRALLPCAA
jgi:hypothetical protein